jgi:Protein of unknown function (DUF742)
MTTPPHDGVHRGGAHLDGAHLDGADDEPLARPFLGGAAAPADDRDGDPNGGDTDDVRPYVITAGRTPSGPAIPLEALVRTTERGEAAPAAYEAARILALCRHPQSIAELSAHLGVPVGVTRVLVADLTAAELLAIGARPTAQDLAADPTFLERLMLGVAAL